MSQRERRINMIAALSNQKLIAPFTVEGQCNRVVFETWLSECSIPVLQQHHDSPFVHFWLFPHYGDNCIKSYTFSQI
jgi:hypothetical protein